MTQEQKNQGARDLASMLQFIIQEEGKCTGKEKAREEAAPNDDKQEETNQHEASVNMEDVGEMMGMLMLEQGTNFPAICKNPKFQSVFKQTVNGITEMLTGATRVVKDLPEDGLTVESGLAAIAETMTKNATRSSSHEFIEYIIHEDKQMAMEIMSKMYDGKSGVKVVWLTLFFIENGWITEPSPAAIIDTFNVKKFSKQLYSANKNLAIPTADHKAFSACLDNLIDSYKSRCE